MPILPNLPKSAKATVSVGTMLSGSYKVPLSLSVNFRDSEVRKAVPNFNGLEEVFALVPVDTFHSDNPVRWERRELTYNKKSRKHEYSGEITGGAINRLGVAFGAETNVDLYWFQNPDQNFMPKKP
jgi:hypothetical protein